MKQKDYYSKIDPQILEMIRLAEGREYETALNLGKRLLNKNKSNEILLNTLSIVYRRLGKYKQAEFWARRAISINKAFWAAHSSLAAIHSARGDIEKAIEKYKSILTHQPKYVEARGNLAFALKGIGDYNGALNEYRKTLRIKKSNIWEWHMGLTLLHLGSYDLGWEKHEYRWRVAPLKTVSWPIKDRDLWEGQENSRVVLWREQGIGDDLLFLGLVPEAFKRSKALSVYTDARLFPLCKRSMPGIHFKEYKAKIEGEEFDYHLPMGSLPRLFRNSEKDFDRTVKGYLKADSNRVELLRDELGLKGKRVIGISWKSTKSLNQAKKSLDLKELAPVFKDLDVVFLNLQYGDVDKEIRDFKKETGIEVIQCTSVDNREDLDGLAALIELCDLVVSTSNVTIHLAGALAKETWVLLPYVANFWWLIDRSDSLWYPTLKLYRQKKYGNWSTVYPGIISELKKKFN
jgi:hypothetical protein